MPTAEHFLPAWKLAQLNLCGIQSSYDAATDVIRIRLPLPPVAGHYIEYAISMTVDDRTWNWYVAELLHARDVELAARKDGDY